MFMAMLSEIGKFYSFFLKFLSEVVISYYVYERINWNALNDLTYFRLISAHVMVWLLEAS